jgi:hypothetical protein
MSLVRWQGNGDVRAEMLIANVVPCVTSLATSIEPP